MDMSKHSEPSKHKEQLQSDNVCEKMCTPNSIIKKLHAMPEDWKKKLQLNKIYCENATWCKVNDMFQELSERKPMFGYKPKKHLVFGIYFIAFFLN